MAPQHVLALIPLPAATRAALAARHVLHEGAEGPPDRLAPVTAVVTNGTTGLSAAQMDRLPALRLVCAFGVGYEGIDLAATRARGITVANAPDTNGETVADHAFGFLLALARGYAPLTAAVRAGGWDSARAARPTLHGATLGILGMGRVGSAIAQRALGFAMQVRYHGRRARPELPYTYDANVVDLARASDFLVACCPGGAATRHLVNADVLAALGPQGFIVNVARGSVVDTAALIAALQAGTLGGAGLDVLDTEPAVPAALHAFDNVLVTPHMAGRSPAAQAAQTAALLASLDAFFAGRSPASVVVPA